MAQATAGFEPLDVSEYVIADENPEVAALKAKVQEVAKVYTDRHGWCAEVKKALREMGIEPERKIVVDVETSVFGDLTTKVLPSKLHGKTAREQALIVADSFTGLALTTGNAEVKITPAKFASFITGLKEVSTPASPFDAVNPEDRWMLLPHGRVAHLFEEYTRSAREDLWTFAACGGGGDSIYSLKTPKADSKKCARCVKRDESHR